MIVAPPKRPQKYREPALIVPGWRSVEVHDDRGVHYAAGANKVYDLLKTLEEKACYVESGLRSLIHTTGARSWGADVWRGRATTMRLYGTKVSVSSLRRTLEGVGDPSTQYDALFEVVGLLADQGVRAGSLSSMAWSLWRSTLEAPIELGVSPKIGRRSFYGSRQESTRPRIYKDQMSVDIQSAHPAAMTSRPYGGVMREVSRRSAIDPEVSGLAEARVEVPADLRFPPLPVRLGPEMISWRWGSLEGVWPFCELDAAIQLGCKVEVSRVWAPLTTVEPFGPWWTLMAEGRNIVSPAALKLWKNLTTVLWGIFAMNGDSRSSIQWADDLGERPEIVPRTPRSTPHVGSVHLASETAARVRVRMLLEGLYGDREAPIHVDTDGIIVPASSAARRELGEGFGQWRIKQHMSVIDLRAPQLYRFKDGEKDPWHYVASGVPASMAADVFDRRHPGYQISLSGLDTVIPGGLEIDDEQIRRYSYSANALERAVFGPRMVA